MPSFKVSDIPDISGKVGWVTGANSGIGYETALQLAKHGAKVYLCARSIEKGQAAVTKIKQVLGSDPKGDIIFHQLDLSSLAQVKQSVNAFLAKESQLNILYPSIDVYVFFYFFRVNNAGLVSAKFEKTPDGIEKTLGVNHVAHHYLTSLLVPLLTTSASRGNPSRIVFVASNAHEFVNSSLFPMTSKLDYKKTYSGFPAYARSKLANILDARGWANHVDKETILVNAVHPGAVYTEIYDKTNSDGIPIAQAASAISKIIGKLFFKTRLQGSLTSLYVATSPDIVNNGWTGCYFTPYGVKQEPSKWGRSDEEMERLWEWTEKTIQAVMTNVDAANTPEHETK